MADKKVLVICGSLRKGSLNRMVVNTLPELVPEGMTLVEAPSIGDIPLYNADIQNGDGFPASVTALGDAVREADGVLFVTPEYNFSVPGVLKNAIDWLSRLEDQPFKDKPVAIQTAATGMLGGARCQYHLRQIMVFVEAIVFTKPEVFISFGKNKVDEEKARLVDEGNCQAIQAQLEKFSAFIDKLS